jgi:hypothetical protein
MICFSFFNDTFVIRKPKRIPHYMMTCSKTLSKHLKFYYQTKTNKEMLEHDFQSFANIMIFFFKNTVIKIFPFHIYFLHL